MQQVGTYNYGGLGVSPGIQFMIRLHLRHGCKHQLMAHILIGDRLVEDQKPTELTAVEGRQYKKTLAVGPPNQVWLGLLASALWRSSPNEKSTTRYRHKAGAHQ